MPDNYVDVTNRVDTWYVIFSPHTMNPSLNRWLDAATDTGCRHVYAVRRAGPGIMQVESSAFGAFCEWSPISIPDMLRICREREERVFEWGVHWTPESMAGKLESETLALDLIGTRTVKLEKLRAPVYIQPGYFSCVALVKVFLNIKEPAVQKPRELLDYLVAQSAEEV